MKVGDWGYHDFELVIVKRVDDELGVNEVSTGAFSTGGRNLYVVPLTVRNKIISEEFEYQYKKLKDIQGLNYPDIHRYFIDIWIEAVETTNDDHVRQYYQKIYNFVNNILELTAVKKSTKVQGVEIFR